MKKTFFIALGLVSLIGSLAYAEVPFKKALEELRLGKSAEAYAHLEHIDPKDPYFLNALLELQKIHYQKEEWQKFFGYAAYYRSHYLSSPKVSRDQFIPGLVSLEVLALGKHCLWNEARSVADLGRKLSRSTGATPAFPHDDLMGQLSLQKEYEAALKAQDEGHVKSGAFEDLMYWKLDREKLSKVSHPRVLRVVVASKCKGS